MKAFLTFYTQSPPLYNPLSAFSSKSNLARVSILALTPPFLPHSVTPHFPLFLLPFPFPLHTFFLLFHSLFLLSLVSPLAPISRSLLTPLPAAVPTAISGLAT